LSQKQKSCDIEEDVQAFDAVMRAYGMPRLTKAETAARAKVMGLNADGSEEQVTRTQAWIEGRPEHALMR
jgi:formiminotetrahydrofolate cyclodeaminase